MLLAHDSITQKSAVVFDLSAYKVETAKREQQESGPLLKSFLILQPSLCQGLEQYAISANEKGSVIAVGGGKQRDLVK